MPAPPVPPAFQELESREFSFFPAIVGIDHNLWRFRQANWSEVMVENCKTGSEIWISRRYIGEASTEEPIAIVGLTREFEFKGGMLSPYHKRLLKMPPAVASRPDAPEADDPAARSAARRVRCDANGLRNDGHVSANVLSMSSTTSGRRPARRQTTSTCARATPRATAPTAPRAAARTRSFTPRRRRARRQVRR